LNHTFTISQQLLQWTSGATLSVAVITVIAIVGWIWLMKNQKANSDAAKNSISIKIDRNGKYRYDIVPDSGNGNLLFWIKIIAAIIAIALFLIPLNNLLNRS
jgi:hypothetical protein